MDLRHENTRRVASSLLFSSLLFSSSVVVVFRVGDLGWVGLVSDRVQCRVECSAVQSAVKPQSQSHHPTQSEVEEKVR